MILPKRSRMILYAITIIALSIVWAAAPLKRIKAQGESNSPAIHDGDSQIVETISYKIGIKPRRGDIIVFKFDTPTELGIELRTKRVVGLPNETVEVGKYGVKINGKKLREKYIRGPRGSRYDKTKITLQDNEYFVLGDNRLESYDSRDWGALSGKMIVGKIMFK